ncbi:hypothetical protein WDU94_007274 [Cyamophila willieti]
MSLASPDNLIMKPPPLPPKKIIRSAAHLNLSSNLNNFPPSSPTLSSPDRSFNGITAFDHYDQQSPKKHIHICKKHRAQNNDSDILVIEDDGETTEFNYLEQKSIPVSNPKMCKRLAKIKPMMKNDQIDSNEMDNQSITDENNDDHLALKNKLISEIKHLNSGDLNKDVIPTDKSSSNQALSFQNVDNKHVNRLTFSSNSDMSSSFCHGETQQCQNKAIRRNSFNGTHNEQTGPEKTKRKNSFNELKSVLKFGGSSDKKKAKDKEKKGKIDKNKDKCDKVSKDMVDSICKPSDNSGRKVSFDNSPKIEFKFDMHVSTDIKNIISTKKERKSELYEILKNKNNEMNEIISKENDIIASIKAKEQPADKDNANRMIIDNKECNVNNNKDEKNCDKTNVITNNESVSDTNEKNNAQQTEKIEKGNVSPTKSVNFVSFVDTIDDSSPKLSKANRTLRLKINNDIKPVSILKKPDSESGSNCSSPMFSELPTSPSVTSTSPLQMSPSPALKPFERKSSFRSNTNELQEIKQKIDDSFQKQNLILQNRLQNLPALTSYSSLRKQRNSSKTNLTRSHSDSNLSVASSYRNSMDLDEIFVVQDFDGNRDDTQVGPFSKYFKVLSGSWKNLFTWTKV